MDDIFHCPEPEFIKRIQPGDLLVMKCQEDFHTKEPNWDYVLVNEGEAVMYLDWCYVGDPGDFEILVLHNKKIVACYMTGDKTDFDETFEIHAG